MPHSFPTVNLPDTHRLTLHHVARGDYSVLDLTVEPAATSFSDDECEGILDRFGEEAAAKPEQTKACDRADAAQAAPNNLAAELRRRTNLARERHHNALNAIDQFLEDGKGTRSVYFDRAIGGGVLATAFTHGSGARADALAVGNCMAEAVCHLTEELRRSGFKL